MDGDGSAIATQQDRVFATLCDEIIAGRYSPGDKLAIEELGRRFAVSAMPIRDAMRRLAEAGVVDLRPKRAVRILPLTPANFDEIGEMRIALETIAASAAVGRATPDQIDLLERMAADADRCFEEGPATTYQSLNCAFHFSLYALSDRPLLCRTIRNLWLRLGPYFCYWAEYWRDMGTVKMRDQHFNIMLAMRRGDADLVAALIRSDVSVGLRCMREQAFRSQPRGARGAIRAVRSV